MYRIWWNQITRANRLVSKITEAIYNNKSVVINTTGSLPWSEKLIEIIDDNMRETSGIRSLVEYESPEGEVGEFLKNEFCKKTKRLSYRIAKTSARFLAESEDVVLNQRVVWIKNTSGSKLPEWLDFIEEYYEHLPSGIDPGIFIIETDKVSKFSKSKNIEFISIPDSISDYDRYAFCTLVSTDLNMDSVTGQYLARLVSTICADDVELCAECMARGNEFMSDPEAAVHSIVETKNRDDGTPFVFNLGSQQIANLIWECQIGMVFPALERYRNGFIRRHYRDILKALPIKTDYETITNPEDVELGPLFSLSSNGYILMQNNMELSVIRKFKDARNDLAHLTPLDYETVRFILAESK